MKALIVAGGEKPSAELLIDAAKDAEIIIGADRGCEYLFQADLKPNYIVGDFDSADKDIIDSLEALGAVKISYNCEKDSTDSDIALELAIEKGAEEIVIAAVTGSRIDHTFANFGLLRKAAIRGVKAVIINDTNKMFLAEHDMEVIRDKRYKYISFLAYTGKVNEFNIEGAKYPLKGYDLEVGDNRTVSNEFIEDTIKISFKNGIILVIYSKD